MDGRRSVNDPALLAYAGRAGSAGPFGPLLQIAILAVRDVSCLFVGVGDDRVETTYSMLPPPTQKTMASEKA